MSCRSMATYLIHLCRAVLMKGNIVITNLSSLPAVHIVGSSVTWHDFASKVLFSCLELYPLVALEMPGLTSDTQSLWQNSVSSLFWKQRIWTQLSASLETKLKAGPHFQLALLSLLVDMSGVVISDNKPFICSLCVQSVSAAVDGRRDDEITTSVRGLAVELLERHFSVLSESIAAHLTSIAPACVHLALTAESARDRQRSLSLLLSMCTTYPFHKLYPVQSEVVRGLLEVLNDRKRAVRILAAKTRNEWSVLEKP